MYWRVMDGESGKGREHKPAILTLMDEVHGEQNKNSSTIERERLS